MTTTATTARTGSALGQLTAMELRRYATHPLFIIGVLLTVATTVGRPDQPSSGFFNAIVPAAGLGILGLVAMAAQTRKAATLNRAAGVTPVPERVQTAALALTALLPFTVGLLWVAWAMWAQHHWPVPDNGFPFGPAGDGWTFAALLGEGAFSALGGPLLGIVVGRYLPQRGTAPIVAVLLVAVAIVFQGIFEPLRSVRVIMPFTYWGGPIGVEGDDMRMLLLSGSPGWWAAYLGCLCGLAVVAALWHDPSARTPALRLVGGALFVAAVVTCLLAMFTGVEHTLVNPLPSGA
ncbi:hypothetical protein [Dactylosporangium sp. NPDC051484]|uniref:hypothetical protein n=1 Tax=Dactylosporangium sp. NPDC051484 TaxID=3154942 RepID=UPI00344F323F